MSHAVVSPQSMLPRNQSNQRNYLSTFYWKSMRDHMCVNGYRIKRKIISMQNPQANAIVKRAHQMLRNLIRSFNIQDNPYLDLDDPWSGILAAALFAMF